MVQWNVEYMSSTFRNEVHWYSASSYLLLVNVNFCLQNSLHVICKYVMDGSD